MLRDVQRWERLARAADLYFQQGLTQDEVARELGLSRPSVSRLLKEARQEKVVEIRVHYPFRRATALERALVAQFGLREARVAAEDCSSQSSGLSTVGALAASFLQQNLAEGSVVGLCSGSTTSAVIDAVSGDLRVRISVVQMVGSLGKVDQRIDSADLVRRLSNTVGGEYHLMPAPRLVENPAIASAFLQEKRIKEVLDLARHAHIALIGIGSLNPQSSHLVQAGYLSAQQIAELRAAGAVADVISRFVDIHGHPVPTRFDGCVVGLTLEELRAIPLVIAAACGEAKSEAILGALRAGMIHVLCTDRSAAERVLHLNEIT
jgi:DNA-binding transcriptional regulator LsrR (DeoR family)